MQIFGHPQGALYLPLCGGPKVELLAHTKLACLLSSAIYDQDHKPWKSS